MAQIPIFDENSEDLKRYYSISEVADMFEISKSQIRFWEGEFDILKPHKNSKGERRFTKENIAQLKKIYQLVKERGFKVIRNLTGHMLNQYELHGEKEVPTYAGSKAIGKIEEGEVYAIEVFVTNGEGYAKSIDEVHIYSLLPELPKRLPIRVKAARDILNFIRKERKGLPFSVRWLRKHFDNATVKVGLSLLEQYGVLIPYPVLVEKGNGIVAQHEETVLVKKDETIVLTQVK